MFKTLNYWITSISLGFGLAMDSFSVSIINSFNEPNNKKKMNFMSFLFGVFQALMPLIGWFCVHYVAQIFTSFQKVIPWIALILLLYIGGKMLIEGLMNKQEEAKALVTKKDLYIEAIATSIDALSTGFTISSYSFIEAFICSGIIGLLTYLMCLLGCQIGKKFGTKLSTKASMLGGLILIGIGVKIFIEGVIK